MEVPTEDGGTRTETRMANVFTCGGVELDTDSMNALMKSIYDLTAPLAPQEVTEGAGEELLSVTFERDAGEWSRMTLSLLDLDEEGCLFRFNGEYRLCGADTAEELVGGFREALRGT